MAAERFDSSVQSRLLDEDFRLAYGVQHRHHFEDPTLVQAGVADLGQTERFYRIATSHPKPRVEYLYTNRPKSSVGAIQDISGNRTRHFHDQVPLVHGTGRSNAHGPCLGSHPIIRKHAVCQGDPAGSKRIARLEEMADSAGPEATECVVRHRSAAWNGPHA